MKSTLSAGDFMESKAKVYNFLVEYIREHLYAPSIREICSATGLKSTSSVHECLHKLAEDGVIHMGQNLSPRCITLVGYKIIKDT